MQTERMELTQEEALTTLVALSMHYPNSGHTPDSLAVVAQDVAQDMAAEGVSAYEFRAAIAECRRSCKFFPAVPDILEAHRRLCAAAPQGEDCLALPDKHPADKNPAMALILSRARQIRVAAEKSRRTLSFSEAYERAKREVEAGALND